MELLKVGTANSHFIYKYGYDGSFKKVKECGFDSVDYSFFAYQDKEQFLMTKSDKELKSICSDIKSAAEDTGVIVGQTHAPYYFVPTERYFDKDMQEIFIKSIKATAYLNSPYIVIHPIIFKDPENNFMKSIEVNEAFYKNFASVANDYNVTIAVENLCAINPLKNTGVPSATSSPEKLNYLLDKLGDGFCACLDTGHSFFCGQNPADFVRGLKGRLKVLHVQDGDGDDDMHIPPTLGLIDWQDFTKALAEVNYQGVINMEISYRKFGGMENIIQTGKYLSAIGKEFAEKIEEHRCINE